MLSIPGGIISSLNITNSRQNSTALKDDETASISSKYRLRDEPLKHELRSSRQSNWEANRPSDSNSGSFRHALTVRTSSLKGHRPASHDDSHTDETQSLFPLSSHKLLAPFSVDDRASLQSNWSSGQPSSVDLSSLQSYSAVSVPATFDRNLSSLVRNRPATMLGGASISSSGPMEGSSRFSSPIGRFDQPDLRNPALTHGQSSSATSDFAEEMHKNRLQL